MREHCSYLCFLWSATVQAGCIRQRRMKCPASPQYMHNLPCCWLFLSSGVRGVRPSTIDSGSAECNMAVASNLSVWTEAQHCPSTMVSRVIDNRTYSLNFCIGPRHANSALSSGQRAQLYIVCRQSVVQFRPDAIVLNSSENSATNLFPVCKSRSRSPMFRPTAGWSKTALNELWKSHEEKSRGLFSA